MLHDPLLGYIDGAEPETDDVAEVDTPEPPATPDLLDSFATGCAQTWADVRAGWKYPLDALDALKHWQPPSAAGHDIYVQSISGDRFEELHQKWIGRGGVRLGVAWIGLVSRGRIFWPVLLAAAAVTIAVLFFTH